MLPGTTLASFQRTSPVYDAMALAAYFSISRELKDAYPAEYNDLGKILGTIANVAKGVIGTIFPPARVPLEIASSLLSGSTQSHGVGTVEPQPELRSAAELDRLRQTQVVPAARAVVTTQAVNSVRKKLAARAASAGKKKK